MRLTLDLPARAEREEREGHVVARWDETSLAWGPLTALPDDRGAWIQHQLRAGTRAGARIELIADALERTRTGWPVRIVLTRLAGAERVRVHAFYAFFEHAAVLAGEVATRADAEALRAVLRTGAPRWEAGVAALAQLWDVPAGAAPPTISEATPSATHHRQTARTHAHAGRPRDAIATWKAAADLDPLDVDSLYNAGVAYAGLGEHASALACWERGLARKPADFWFLRKIVQAHNALGRFEEAAAARTELLRVWASSEDPPVQRACSFVFHQATVDGLEVHGSEVLARGDERPTLFFEVPPTPHAHAHTAAARVRVLVEPLPGDRARLTLERAHERRQLELLDAIPALPELVVRAARYLAAALATPAVSPPSQGG